jgi:hypothetical protein
VKYWEIIADNLSKAGWSWGCVATMDREGRTIFVADAHRDDGKRFVARADEELRFAIRWQSSTSQRQEMACSKMSKAIKERSARNSESEVNGNQSESLGRQGRLDHVNFGTYVPRI